MIRIVTLLAALITHGVIAAQYCTPTFSNGCSNWHTTGIQLGSINYTATSPCSDHDFTTMSTNVIRGQSYPMTVTSVGFTGVAVYLDANNDQVFSDSEALYHTYAGCDACTYNFTITIPPSTSVGPRRLRVITPWAMDGGPSQLGPCGAYEYGNFKDLTLNVTATSYCYPQFNDCASWNLDQVQLGGITWDAGPNCMVYDHLNTVFPIISGLSTAMSVSNGHWCGVSVWVDLNADFDFAPSELLYEHYAGVEIHTYNFNIQLPPSVPAGFYRMRVMSPWAESGSSSGNCHSYQYGNFADFTLNVTGQVGIDEHSIVPMKLWPNPTSDRIDITSDTGSITSLELRSMDGRLIRSMRFPPGMGRVSMDLRSIDQGAYVIVCGIGEQEQWLRFVKE